MDNDKELVWLPKELVDEIKKIEDPFSEECRSLISKYIDETKTDYKQSLEMLDEDVLMYRGLMVKAKKSFEDAKNEQLDAHYELWEKFDKELPKTEERINNLISKISPLKYELNRIDEAIKKIKLWDIEKLLEIINSLNSILSYDNNTSKILRFLINEYTPNNGG